MQRNDRLSRRQFVRSAGAAAAALAVSGRAELRAETPASRPALPLAADAALRDLLEGNERFVAGRLMHPRRSPADFAAVAAVQRPDAIVVGCADARVSPEVLFDQGVGDLFVVRVAGNVVHGAGPIVKGSIEYGVAELGAPLIMVLGHSNCGAVKAAVKHIDAHDLPPGAIGELVRLIEPVVARVRNDPGNLLENAIVANVSTGVERLKSLDPVIAPAVKAGKLAIVGATYDLNTGRVRIVA